MVVLTSFTQPTDGIRHRQNNTTVYVNDNNLGKGTLFIAESRLSWVSDSGNGFSLEYPHISLHAVSRDLSAFPQECLFLMLDTALGDDEMNNGNGENGDGDENDSEGETTEIRLVPDDRGMLDAMFHAMNACQALHPDPEDSFSDEDFYEDADDEIPMEETDYRMAGLRIESTDGMPRIGRGVAGADMEADMEAEEEDISDSIWAEEEEDRVVGGSISVGQDRVVGGSTSVGEDRVEAGMAEGGNTWVGGSGVAGSRVEARWGAGLGRMAGGIRAVGEAAVEEQVEGRAGSTCTSGGAGVEDTVGDRAEGRVGRTYTSGGEPRDMGRGGRPFPSGSIWHQGRSGLPPPAYSPHTALQNHHNFDDAEN